uniref:CCHC-type domain-containing protein n=1 Tax=Meloidogyne floridensis TaxID=298350 RepID=A0A915NNZ2_9BILA
MGSNSNYTPLGQIRRWSKNEDETLGQQSTSAGLLAPIPGEQIGIQGEILVRAQLATGACTKCGYVGHLPFQCRNFIQIKPNQKTEIDISSTSSEEYTTPLTSKEDKKKLKKMKKRQKKEMKKLEKKIKKENKKKYRKRKHSSSSSSDISSNSTSSEKSRKRHKKKLKSKLKKKKYL